MLGLRWTLGVIAALVAAGWLALSIVAGGFRRSFGASDQPAWMVLLPLVVSALLIVSVLWPDRRGLLHVVALVMLATIVGCVVIARDAAFLALLGILYASAWLSFYNRVLRP